MRTVARVGIKKLKDNLSAYVRDVRRGARVLVTDHDEIVAELSQPRPAALPDDLSPLLLDWIRSGKATPPRRPKRPVPRSPVRLKAGTAARILDQLRGE